MTDTATKTFGLRHGVIYTANPAQLSPYARRVASPNSYDQCYGQFVLVTVPEDDGGPHAGESWMIDTYHIGNPCKPHLATMVADAAKRDFVPSQAVASWQWDCYYNDCVKLTASVAPFFTEFCDLSAYECVPADEVADYSPEDIVEGVHIAREVGYGMYGGRDFGITLRRKGCEKAAIRQASHIVSRMLGRRADYTAWGFETEARRLEEFAWEHRDDPAVVAAYEAVASEIAFARRIANERRCEHDPYCVGSDQMEIEFEGSATDGE